MLIFEFCTLVTFNYIGTRLNKLLIEMVSHPSFCCLVRICDIFVGKFSIVLLMFSMHL